MTRYLRYLKKIRPLLLLARRMRGHYRRLRTAYLLRRYPVGAHIRCSGIDVFCDFRDESYTWYVDAWPSLALARHVLNAIEKRAEGNVFIDIGAHWGFFAACLAEIAGGRSAPTRIIALEPDPNHFRCLQETMARYALQAPLLLPFALSSDDDMAAMYKSDSSCLHSYGGPQTGMRYAVPGISLDSLARRYLQPAERVAVIKIDIDGAEPVLFYGGARVLQKDKPIILMEFAPRHLREFGLEDERFYMELCDSYFVYWVCYEARTVRRVSHMNYREICLATGAGVSDLVLSTVELDFGALTG